MLNFGLTLSFTPPEQYQPLAIAAEKAGFTWVTLSDHLVYPETMSAPYPYTEDGKPRFTEFDAFPDPWIAVTAMAAVTQRLKFYTSIYILPARNPVHVAKTVGSAAVFSNNRIALGIGMGWMPEEFAAGGQEFSGRGRRADEMIEVMRKLWTGDRISHDGSHYQLPPMRMSPAPTEPVPIYAGGFSKPAMKRAARNDGWISDLHTKQALLELVEQVLGYRADLGKSVEDFPIFCFSPTDMTSLEDFKTLEAAGVTTVSTMPWMMDVGPDASLTEKISSIENFGRSVIAGVCEL